MKRRAADDNCALARLAAVVHPADPHVDRILAASDAVALEIVRLAKEHRISALLSRALESGGRLDAAPAAARAALRQDVLDALHARARVDADLQLAAGALDAAGTPFVLLKGAALGVVAYERPYLRAMTDVDLLVRERDLGPALAGLERAGFRRPSADEEVFWKDSYYNLPVRAPGPGDGLLEIHWSIAQSTRQRPDIDGVFARSRIVDLNGRATRAPGAADLLLHQALHLSYHYYEPRLVWLYDLALLHQASPPVDEVIRRAARWGMSTPLALSVLHVAKTFPGAADRDLLAFAEHSGRARVICALFGARSPAALIAGWDRRPRQLVLAALMVERPSAAFAAAGSWLRRAVVHGDRAGRRRRPTSGGAT